METLQLNKFLLELYDISIQSHKKLDGYDNQNYLIKSRSSQKFILKIYNFSQENLSFIQAENDCLNYLSKFRKSLYPRPIKSLKNSYAEIVELDNSKKIIRMLSYLEGTFIGEVKQTPHLYKSIGRLIANLSKQLKNYKNHILSTRKWQWDIQYLRLNKKYLPYINNPSDRKIVQYFMQQFEENVIPKIDSLRTAVIHNDTNEWNILINRENKLSIIDFGDLTKSQLINEVAVTLTYASYNSKNPLDSASIVLKSFNKIIKLTDKEISLLYYLISAKLCISVCNSAYSKKVNPENKYALVSEKKAWKMLRFLVKTSPVYVENIFRKAVGKKIKKNKNVNELIKKREKVVSKLLSISYKKPIVFESSAFQYMFDNLGNSYLDAYNNIPIVGHAHPKINEAISNQSKKLNTNTRYIYEGLYDYSKMLLKKFPKKLNKIYFVNSGSEASDLAIKLALSHSRNEKVMVLENGYHGNTQRGTEISHYKFSQKKGIGKKDYVVTVPMPSLFNNKFNGSNKKIGEKYAIHASKSINNIAAFISEPILGCGGQVVLPPNYLKIIYEEIRRKKGVCISDEVQTGFGRLGKYFWGFEMHDVIPDIVILGKSIGNGHPIGAVVTTSEVSKSFEKGVEFFSSFGGNPISCAVGISVLEIIEQENLQENARIVGNYYKKQLKKVQKKFPCIGDVRGEGLFLGFEIVKENSKIPDTDLAQKIKNELRTNKVLVGSDGPYNNVIKTKPPLCFSMKNVDTVINSLEKILGFYFPKDIKLENNL